MQLNQGTLISQHLRLEVLEANWSKGPTRANWLMYRLKASKTGATRRTVLMAAILVLWDSWINYWPVLDNKNAVEVMKWFIYWFWVISTTLTIADSLWAHAASVFEPPRKGSLAQVLPVGPHHTHPCLSAAAALHGSPQALHDGPLCYKHIIKFAWACLCGK